MHISQHAHLRMNQRGISRRLVDFTLRHGRVEGNKYVLDRSESRRVINELVEELRCAKRILDKGGMTVVEGGDVVITAYNVNVPPRRRHAATAVTGIRAVTATAEVTSEPRAMRSHASRVGAARPAEPWGARP
jgi:hypothetical protein